LRETEAARIVRSSSAAAGALAALAAAALLWPANAAAAGAPDLEIGRRLYRDGIRASGRPVKVIVAGDTEFEGTQFNCQTCHRRSGLGSFEGDVVASMVTAAALYEDKTSGPRKRRAYTDETLARALRDGVDSDGQPFDPIMPRYELTDVEAEGLIAYLRTLSAQVSPGVTEEQLHLATVITGDIDAGPMLDVLQTFFDEKNNQRRNPEGRRKAGPFYRANVDQAYRRWELHPWRLTGGAASWRAQLEEHYRQQPVFALISGLGGDEWRPIHEFCEAHEIPCLLPNIDLPPIETGDYYSLYFSEGLTLEARAIASQLSSGSHDRRVLQVVHPDARGETAAAALRGALDTRAGRSVEEIRLDRQSFDAAELERRIDASDATVVVLWLTLDEIEELAPWIALGRASAAGPRIYLSSTLTGGSPSAIPEPVRQAAHIAHPFTLDDELPSRFARAKVWLESRGIEIRDPRIQAQTYFVCMLLGEALMHVKYDYFFRDYLIESIDHMTVLSKFSIAHPSPSFGPGQRFISKGCYVLAPAGTAADGAEDAVTWIVPGHTAPGSPVGRNRSAP